MYPHIFGNYSNLGPQCIYFLKPDGFLRCSKMFSKILKSGQNSFYATTGRLHLSIISEHCSSITVVKSGSQYGKTNVTIINLITQHFLHNMTQFKIRSFLCSRHCSDAGIQLRQSRDSVGGKQWRRTRAANRGN